MRSVFQLYIAVFLPAGSCLAQQTSECLPCHGVRDLSIQASDGRIINMYVDPARYGRSVHGGLLCHQCHVNMATRPHAELPAPLPRAVEPYTIRYRPETRPAAGSCITCHPEEWDSYRESIHAEALRDGKPDAPFCSDCHGSHYILGTEDLESQINPTHVPHTCASCHAVGLLKSRYDVETNTHQTFQQSVHGRKLALGESKAAVCTSCHGVHDIKSPLDPDSPLYPTHIAGTCRNCHEGASAEFALTFKHVTPSPTVEPLVFYVQLAYKYAIGLMIGVMAAYVLLDLLRRTVEWSRRRREACE